MTTSGEPVYYDCCEHCEHDQGLPAPFAMPPDQHVKPCEHGCNDIPAGM